MLTLRIHEDGLMPKVVSVDVIELDQDVEVFDVEVEQDMSFLVGDAVLHNSGICRARAGRVWRLSDKRPIGHSLSFQEPPLHWSCRSHLVPILHAWRDMPDDVKQRMDKDDLSGKPASEPDLDEWMSRNPQQAGPITLASARRQLGLK